jgi:dipeptidyl aminopeptidase/acylaminoacyl peptidase
MTRAPLPIERVYLAHALSEPAFGDTPDVFYYVKQADGRRAIIRQTVGSGLAQTLTTEPTPAGGIGYGGGLFAVRGDTLVYAAKGGTLQAIDLTTGAQWPITPACEGVAAPVFSPCGRFVAYLAEQNRTCNVLLADVRGRSLPVKLSADPWYAFNPVFSPDGARIAWQEWSELDMPWDESRVVIARLARPTAAADVPASLVPSMPTTMARPRVSYGSPQFSPDGAWLAFTSDESGWRSLWVTRVDADDPSKLAVQVDTGDGEIGGPDWLPGLVRLRWSGDDAALYVVRRHRSRDTLLRVAWPAGSVREVRTAWTWIADVNVRGDRVIFVGAHPAAPETLVTLDPSTGEEVARATTAVGLLDPTALAEAEVVSWNTVDSTSVSGIFYRAMGNEADPRPLIVTIHGGPTSERPLTWAPDAQYFATRGWHYLVVNHRGSTGAGRAYQDRLAGQWGVVDVEDARTGAEHLVAAGLADRRRLVITGASAGGFTTLSALTRDPAFWAAGVSVYGIGDLYELKRGSHRFEANYEETLVGRLPEAGPLWKERSPLTHVKSVRAPVLLFHGKDDVAVPYQQSVDFVEAVHRQGGIAELVSYEGEGHGFVREATRRDCLERTERFLDKYVRCLQR